MPDILCLKYTKGRSHPPGTHCHSNQEAKYLHTIYSTLTTMQPIEIATLGGIEVGQPHSIPVVRKVIHLRDTK